MGGDYPHHAPVGSHRGFMPRFLGASNQVSMLRCLILAVRLLLLVPFACEDISRSKART
jgi:hypothetical protein